MAFADPDAVQVGWHWAALSRDLRRGKTLAVRVMGRDLALYRGEDGLARCVDAYCPHMGAHLALGRVEGQSLRCFFHGWRFDAEGRCAEIPALDAAARADVCLVRHAIAEQDGLIWLWIGEGAPAWAPPIHEALKAAPRRALIVSRWRKGCHPNVVLVNAIDEQHFRTVHRVPGEALRLALRAMARHHFRVENEGAPPRTSWLWRMIGALYRGERLAYDIDYFSGVAGCVRLGPPWARLHLMFAARTDENGAAEGITIAVAQRREGWLGALADAALLRVAALAGAYFAVGDTKVFNSIRFDLKTPIPADRTIVAYVRHLEAQQRVYCWARPRAHLQAAAE